ncbi:MAG: hypothetical protein WA324_02450 [Bryobacteraceae bacterium]
MKHAGIGPQRCDDSGESLQTLGGDSALWKRLQTTLAWLDANIQHFDPLPTGFPSYRSLKRFAELSIALMCLRRLSTRTAGRPWLESWVQRTSEFQILNFGRPAYQESLVKDPLGAFSFALPYLVLRGTGHRCIALERAMKRLLGNGLFLSVEMIPFRALDRLYFLKLAGLSVTRRGMIRWYRKTTLGARRDAVFNLDDAYSVTHTVFYMCDFGRSHTLFDETESARVLIALESLLVHSWRIRNWDLMGEVLAAMTCLGVDREDPLVREAEITYYEAYRPDGTMPPNQAVQRRQRNRPKPRSKADLRESSYFSDCYHSTLVFLLFAAINLQPCATRAN